MWFAALSAERKQPVGRDIWLANLLWKLLHHDETAIQLIDQTPFQEEPQAIRVLVYRYSFSYEENHWWKREKMHTWIPALRKDNAEFRAFVQRQGWWIED